MKNPSHPCQFPSFESPHASPSASRAEQCQTTFSVRGVNTAFLCNRNNRLVISCLEIPRRMFVQGNWCKFDYDFLSPSVAS
ncbi:hypothetical protein LSTR_LSTR007350 [Laodelphax striatellus]|uniref:Uncharacterized protein n=1 Tax=Laodelphax striatellus TaxID=195883 RepID=A0A482XNF8_LAOST|nr:hypothetical protein LSTR_LSTR007350 [Laodelphax striatellus]